jgi:zinc protease
MIPLSRLLIGLLLIGLLLPLNAFAYQTGAKVSETDKIPLDEKVVEGVLPNGLKYLIRSNNRPEKRAELRLVLDAGSILERNDQLGLAHFVEHMAFNGTKKFEKQDLVKYLESVGMRFGPDINAYTSFDETVYMLQLPTDSAGVVETGLQILRDWAGNVTFDSLEVEKERGVVVEEWRLRRGGDSRIQDRQFPVLLHDSQYSERLPIGSQESLLGFAQERLRAFYAEWYRPDLMTVVAVGDFDAKYIESQISVLFRDLRRKNGSLDRPYFDVPDHAETLFSIESDPEASSAFIGLSFKHEVGEVGTFKEYDESLRRSLFSSMLNQRLGELTQKSDPPFIGAGAGDGILVRTKAAFSLNAGVKDGEYLRALESILGEIERVRQFGFTQSEFDRVRLARLRRMEVSYNERDNEHSAQLAAEYVRHALYGESIPGIGAEFNLLQNIIPKIELDEINALVPELMTNDNLVVSVSGPGTVEMPLPSRTEIEKVFSTVSELTLTAYEDVTTEAALLPAMSTPGSIVAEKSIPSLNLTEWTLSNGIKVVLKPTDFKADEVLLSATSPGGLSLAPDADYMSATFSTNLVGGSGAGAFGAVELSKKLTGKIARIRPYVSNLEEGFSGSASPQDLETMFQLSYLYATAPRADSSVFASFMSRINSMLSTLAANPQSAFGDTLGVTLSQYHFRSRPFSSEILSEVDLGTGLEFFKDRFSDFSDFTFYLVGAFEPNSIRSFVETYWASLPSSGRMETPRDDGKRTPMGVIKKEVYKGVEEQSQIALIFSGESDWSMAERRRLALLKDVVEKRLREVLREDLGGTYGVSVLSNFQDKPFESFQFSISFGCAPDRVEELISNVWANIRDLQSNPPSETHLKDAKEAISRAWETGLKENGYWLTALQFYMGREMDPERILVNPAVQVDEITGADIVDAANTFLNSDRYVQVVLYPESHKQ